MDAAAGAEQGAAASSERGVESTGVASGVVSAVGSYRILIVDDNRSIHVDFHRILGGEKPVDPELDELATSLLGALAAPPSLRCRLDSAYQGEEALAAVERANEEGRPYALVFMDIRMQPGWSGVETAARVLEADGLVHIILCTGHAGHEWRREVEALTTSDRVLLLKKPFDPLEVRQMAKAICHKWTLVLRDRRRMQELERAVSEKTSALEAANEQLRREMTERARAERELLRAQQLEGLGRLAAGLCHEIRRCAASSRRWRACCPATSATRWAS
jgi:two-component system NtrC family sensor kinase